MMHLHYDVLKFRAITEVLFEDSAPLFSVPVFRGLRIKRIVADNSRDAA